MCSRRQKCRKMIIQRGDVRRAHAQLCGMCVYVHARDSLKRHLTYGSVGRRRHFSFVWCDKKSTAVSLLKGFAVTSDTRGSYLTTLLLSHRIDKDFAYVARESWMKNCYRGLVRVLLISLLELELIIQQFYWMKRSCNIANFVCCLSNAFVFLDIRVFETERSSKKEK